MCIVLSTLFEREREDEQAAHCYNRPLSLASAHTKLHAWQVCLLKVLASTMTMILLHYPPQWFD
jgi:hypothetical protein